MNDNGCWWMPVGSQFWQPQYPCQASSKTSGSSEIHPRTQWPAIYYREQLLFNTYNVCTRTLKATVCMMDSAMCMCVYAKVYVALITLKRCTPLLEYYDSKVTNNSDGWKLWTASFQLQKKQNSCQNNLTHHYAQLPSTSKQLKLKVGTARRSLESRGLQMWLLSL